MIYLLLYVLKAFFVHAKLGVVSIIVYHRSAIFYFGVRGQQRVKGRGCSAIAAFDVMIYTGLDPG